MVTKWRQQPYGMDYQSKLFEHHQGMALCVSCGILLHGRGSGKTSQACASAGAACRCKRDGKTGAFSLREFGVCYFVTIITAYRTGELL